MGLPQPHARLGLQQLHDDVRLRPIRRARAADLDDLDDLLPQQVLLAHEHHERRHILRDLDQLHLDRRYPARRRSTKSSTTARRPAPPSRATSIPITSADQRRHRRRAATLAAAPGLLPVRRHARLDQHLPHQREAAIHRAVSPTRRRTSIISMRGTTMERPWPIYLEDPTFVEASEATISRPTTVQLVQLRT